MKDTGHGKAEGVRRRSIIGEGQVRSQIFPYGVCAGQSDSVTNFSLDISVTPGSVTPQMLHTHSMVLFE
jgi:hypothetical protein